MKKNSKDSKQMLFEMMYKVGGMPLEQNNPNKQKLKSKFIIEVNVRLDTNVYDDGDYTEQEFNDSVAVIANEFIEMLNNKYYDYQNGEIIINDFKLVDNVGEMPLKENGDNNSISIFDYVENKSENGYATALYDKDHLLIDDYVDPSDYPDMMVSKRGEIMSGKYIGGTLGIHSGGLVDMKNVEKHPKFRSRYD